MTRQQGLQRRQVVPLLQQVAAAGVAHREARRLPLRFLVTVRPSGDRAGRHLGRIGRASPQSKNARLRTRQRLASILRNAKSLGGQPAGVSASVRQCVSASSIVGQCRLDWRRLESRRLPLRLTVPLAFVTSHHLTGSLRGLSTVPAATLAIPGGTGLLSASPVRRHASALHFSPSSRIKDFSIRRMIRLGSTSSVRAIQRKSPTSSWRNPRSYFAT